MGYKLALGGQIIEANNNQEHGQALDKENYPHKMGVHDLPNVDCLKKGITSCLDCPHLDYPPCVESAYGKPHHLSR